MTRANRWLAVLVWVVAVAAAPAAPPPRRGDSGTAVTIDAERPAQTLQAIVEQTDRLAAAAPAAPAKAGTAEAARALLAEASRHYCAGDRAALRRAALQARQAAEQAHQPLLSAMANLLLHLGSTSTSRGARREAPLALALATYQLQHNQPGVQLCRALLAREMANHLQTIVGGSAPASVARFIHEHVKAIETGPAYPVADLNAAHAALLVADRLAAIDTDERDGSSPLDPRPWYERAMHLAQRAAPQGPQTDRVTSLAAANLAMHARLRSLLSVDAAAPSSADSTAFTDYDARMREALNTTRDAPALLIGATGLLGSLDLYRRLLLRLPSKQVSESLTRRVLRFTMAVMPLSERPPQGSSAAEALLGAPSRHAPQEYGAEACRTMHRWLGGGVPDELGEVNSYQDFGFWLYERTKGMQLARLLAMLTGEGRLSGNDRRRWAALNEESGQLAQSMVRLAMAQVPERRAETKAGKEGRPRHRTEPVRPLRDSEVVKRYHQVRREQLALELGNDEDARITAGVLDQGLNGAAAQQMLQSPRSAIVALGYDWAFVVTRQGLQWRYPDPKVPAVKLMRQIGTIGDLQVPAKQRLETAQALYDVYLRPLEADLKGVDRLLVVPEGPVACLPLEALVAGRRDGASGAPNDWATARFFGDNHAVEYVPSLTMSAVARQRSRGISRQVSKQLLAIGDPKLGNDVEVGTESQRFVLVPSRGGTENELLRLPFTGLEAKTAVEEVGAARSTLLLGEAANEPAVRRELPLHQMLHFATHGVLGNDRDPLGSGLLLSPDTSGKAGLLTAREVYGMKLPARLAVLSACDTAAGKVRFVSGGVTSLAGAFLYAGVPSVVATLWPVDDEATAAFMRRFYQHDVRHPGDVAVALQSARQSLRSEAGGKWSDPYYWAGFLAFH